MWYFLYNVLLFLASPVIILLLLVKKRCRRGLPERLGLSGLLSLSGLFRQKGPHGLNRPNGPNGPDRPVIWVHAVSLGEVVAAVPLIRELHARFPGFRILVSTVTETGREAVEQRLSEIAEHCYAPLDFPWVVSRVVDRLRPSAFLFIETELWPNLLRVLARRGVTSVLVNGRLSSRSYHRYSLIKSFMRQVLEGVTCCLMQSERDAERIIALGAKSERVVRTGNIKFDQPLPGPLTPSLSPSGGEEKVRGNENLSRSALGLARDEELIVAGSTHPGEETELLTCYELLLREFKSLVLLMAPRHIERTAEVEAVVRAKGLAVQRRSALGKVEAEVKVKDSPSLSTSTSTFSQGKRGRVILLDTRGELVEAYRHAVVAFVGGTLVPVGGHNLLEPALWSKPVLFGPHTDHCAESADLLIQAGGAKRIQDGKELALEIGRLLRDRRALERTGQAAKTMVSENRGAVLRSIGQISCLLTSAGTAPPQKKPVGQILPIMDGRAVKGER